MTDVGGRGRFGGPVTHSDVETFRHGRSMAKAADRRNTFHA
jgi:hypothetical protein